MFGNVIVRCRRVRSTVRVRDAGSRRIFIRNTFLPTVDRATGDIYLHAAQGCLFVNRSRMKDFPRFIILHVIYGILQGCGFFD